MVVAVGDIAHRALLETHALLEAFRSPARHITALGAYHHGNYHAIAVPPFGDTDQMDNALTPWLYATRLEQNIHRARLEGMEVGPPSGYLLEQIVLIVDSNAYESALEVMQELHGICERANDLVPARLYWLVLHPFYDVPLPAAIWRDHLERARRLSSLQEGTMYLLRLVRSDGSNMTQEQLRETTAYLLFAALHPAEFVGEHWFFRSITHVDSAPHTIGCGFLTLPLHKIIQCLQDKLVAEALETLLIGNGEMPAFSLPSETQFWERIIHQAAQEWGQGGAARIQTQGSLDMTATIPVPVPAPRAMTTASLDAITEWENQWNEQRLPQWRSSVVRAAQQVVNEYRENLQAGIQQYLQTSEVSLEALKAKMEALEREIEAWQVHTLNPVSPTPERKTAMRSRLEKTLKEAEQQRRRLWRRRMTPDEEIVSAYAQSLQDYYAQSLRAEAQKAARSAASQIREAIQHQTHTLSVVLERIQTELRERTNRVQTFYLPALPWLKPIVSHWEHLAPVAHSLWGDRNLRALVRQYIDPKRDLREQIPWITEQMEQKLQQWMTRYYRKFSYYLKERFPNLQKRVLWYNDSMAAMRFQAERVLWHTEKTVPIMWRAIPPEEHSSLSVNADAPLHDWINEGVMGYIAVIPEAILEPDS